MGGIWETHAIARDRDAYLRNRPNSRVGAHSRETMADENAILATIGKSHAELLSHIDEAVIALGRVEAKLGRLEVRADRTEMQLDRIEMRLDRIETKLDRNETRIEALEARP
jgi:septal ring factor EnvC (AmiA/AmiB activator)